MGHAAGLRAGTRVSSLVDLNDAELNESPVCVFTRLQEKRLHQAFDVFEAIQVSPDPADKLVNQC